SKCGLGAGGVGRGGGGFVAGRGRPAMPPSVACVTSRWAAGETLRARLAIALIAALHVCALGLLLWTEIGFVPKLAFCLTWALLNFFWLAGLRRPTLSAALSVGPAVILTLLPRATSGIVCMRASFLAVMCIKTDKCSFRPAGRRA